MLAAMTTLALYAGIAGYVLFIISALALLRERRQSRLLRQQLWLSQSSQTCHAMEPQSQTLRL